MQNTNKQLLKMTKQICNNQTNYCLKQVANKKFLPHHKTFSIKNKMQIMKIRQQKNEIQFLTQSKNFLQYENQELGSQKKMKTNGLAYSKSEYLIKRKYNKNGKYYANVIQSQSFSGYLGFGSKSWAAVLQTLLFGVLTLGLSIGLAYILKAGTNLPLNKSLMISTAICSLMVGILFFKLHGQYQLKKEGRYILGDLRNGRMRKKLIGFCFAFVFVMSVPVIGTLLVQNSQQDSSTIFGFIVAFAVQIILAICGHLITNFHQSSQQTASSSGSPYMDQSTVNNIQASPHLNPNFQKKIVKPIIAIFRDSIKTILNIIQIIIIVSITFVPLIYQYRNYSNNFSLQQQNYWESANMKEGTFKFQNTIKQGFNPSNDWEIINENNSLSKYFTNGEQITEQRIKELLNADKYYTNVEFPTNYTTTVSYLQENIWKLSNGTIIKLYQNLNGTFNKLVKIGSNNFQTEIPMNMTNNGAYINGYSILNPYQNKYIYYNVSLILQYLNNQTILYEMSNTIQLVYWRIPDSSNYASNIIQFTWWKHSQYRGGSGLSFIVNNTDFNMQTRSLQYAYYYGVWPKSVISSYEITNFTQQYIDFNNGVFNQISNLYMYNFNASDLPKLTYKISNPNNNLIYNWNTHQFINNNNETVHIFQQFIDTNNISTIVKLNQSNQFDNKIIATFTHDYDSNPNSSNHYFQWAFQAKLYNVITIKTYQYIYYPIKLVNFWIGMYFVSAIVSIIISTIFHCILKKCIIKNKLYLSSNYTIIQQNYLYYHTLFHFIQTLIIFIIGGIPLYIIPFQQFAPSSQQILINLIFSCILTIMIYYFSLKSWNKHSFRNKWVTDLSLFPDIYYKKQINKSLTQIGIAYNEQLIQMLYNYGFKIQFLNSYRIRELLRQYQNIKTLQNELIQFISIQNIQLNVPLSRQTIISQTFDLAFLVLLINFLFLVYAFLNFIFKINNDRLNIKVFIGIEIPIGILSIIYFVWKHRNQVFQKDNKNKITRRITTVYDLIKITILGILMMICIVSFLIISFEIANILGANVSLQFLISLCCGGILGFILASIIHQVWNIISGVMGTIAQFNF